MPEVTLQSLADSFEEMMEFLRDNVVTKEDAKAFLTKEDAKAFATKDDLKALATKDDLQKLELRMDERFDALTGELRMGLRDLERELQDIRKQLEFVERRAREDDEGILKIVFSLQKRLDVAEKELRELKVART